MGFFGGGDGSYSTFHVTKEEKKKVAEADGVAQRGMERERTRSYGVVYTVSEEKKLCRSTTTSF